MKIQTFINEEQENYSGSPDYIFQDEQGNYFVVEEKFHKRKDPYKETYEELVYFQDDYAEAKRENWLNFKIHFYKNHQIQLISYLCNIKEYEIKYGYLIYWFYDFENGEPYIHREAVLEMKLDGQKKSYYLEAKNGIETVLKNKKIAFNKKSLNPKKCAGCVVNKYCAHKSGKLEQLKFPYEICDLSLESIPFPEELKKIST